MKLPEGLPTQVECSIHPWMEAYWLVLDHPYAAITTPDGKFRIEKLPAGEHDFVVWQENVGYLERPKVKIKPGETTDLGTVKVPVAKLTAPSGVRTLSCVSNSDFSCSSPCWCFCQC